MDGKQIKGKVPTVEKMEASQNDFRWRSVQCSVGVAMAYAAVLTIKVRALFWRGSRHSICCYGWGNQSCLHKLPGKLHPRYSLYCLDTFYFREVTFIGFLGLFSWTKKLSLYVHAKQCIGADFNLNRIEVKTNFLTLSDVNRVRISQKTICQQGSILQIQVFIKAKIPCYRKTMLEKTTLHKYYFCATKINFFWAIKSLSFTLLFIFHFLN